MAINKKLIHFKTKANFEKEKEAGNILDTSIVFIQDANLIWTHGTYYCLPNDEVIITDGIEPEDGQEIWIDTSEDSTLFAVEEAPKDGKMYARQNGKWVETSIKSESGGSGEITKELTPNVYYEFGECSSLTITLAAEIPNIYNEYMFEFTSGTAPTTLGLPSTVKWNGGNAPTIEASKSYIVAIVNNIAVIGGA